MDAEQSRGSGVLKQIMRFLGWLWSSEFSRSQEGSLGGVAENREAQLVKIPLNGAVSTAPGAVTVVQIKTQHKRSGDTSKAKILLSFQPPLRHEKIYMYPGTEAGKEFGTCRACQHDRVGIYSYAFDALGKRVKVCLRCLGKYGSKEQVELAAQRSQYARRWVDCVGALAKLEAMFPDPERRPYGDKALRMSIDDPRYGNYDNIERILMRIDVELWTEVDRVAIEKGRSTAEAMAREKYGD